MTKNLLSIVTLYITLIIYETSCVQKVQQLDPQRLQKAIKNNDFTVVYFYSSQCKYCQQFSPKFQKVAKNDKVHGVTYGKMDGPAYKKITQKYDIYSYPSIVLFWKNIDQPIIYLKQRQIVQLENFIESHTKVFNVIVKKQQIQNLTQQRRQSGILYVGDLGSYQLNVTTVLGSLQTYRPFAILHANVSRPYLVIKDVNYYDFDIRQMRKAIRKAFAKLHPIDQQPWLRIQQKSQIGIVFVDLKNRTDVTEILGRLAPQYPELVFLRMDPQHQEFRDGLLSLGVEKVENIYGVHKRYDVKFVAPKPYTQQSIKQFIHKVQNLSAKIYMRSQKTKKKATEKLTFQNYEKKVTNNPKDIVLFIYRQQDQNHNKFMDLFKWIVKKLKNNSNLVPLRCNLSKNQIQSKLGIPIKITPSIVFLAHRMKEKPVHFVKSVVSAENVIEFIMENTTFDWEDQWGEL